MKYRIKRSVDFLILAVVSISPSLLAANTAINVPVHFEPHRGGYIVRGLKTGARLEPGGALRLSLSGGGSFALRFAGGDPRVKPEAGEPLPGRTHYFSGRDPEKWRTNVPHYARVRYRDVYPGIDVVYYGRPGALEYDLVVAPGADPRRVRLRVSGAATVQADGGDLLIQAGGRRLRHARPRIYQETAAGRQEVGGRYSLDRNGGVRIEVATYDPRRPLVIDPMIAYSTLLGGDDEDNIQALAVDAQGNVYVGGKAGSADFPGSPHKAARNRYRPDGYVTKIDAAGATVVFTAVFPGDGVAGIALDTAGNIYATGTTGSADFPVTSNAVQSRPRMNDPFLIKLDPAGSRLLYATLMGGSRHDYARAVAVTPAGHAVVAGYTTSPDFPMVPPVASRAGTDDEAFVFRLDTVSGRLVYSSPFGGSKGDQGNAVALDITGNAYITGSTYSTDFPVTANAFQKASKGYVNTFVVKLNPGGDSILYATLLGGSSSGSTENVGNAIAVDAGGNAYVVGTTNFRDFPATVQLSPKRGGSEAFITKLNPDGSALVYSGLIGGSYNDYGFGVALAPNGEAWVTGTSQTLIEKDFPIINPTQRAWGGGYSDWFLARVNGAGTAITFSTYIGGLGEEGGLNSPRLGGVALDPAGNVYVAGHTLSADFPTTSGVLEPRYGGHATATRNEGEGFIVKIDPSREPAPVVVSARDRVITTVIGGGTVGGATSGPATQAALGTVTAMTLHPSGSVVFATKACGGATIIPGGSVIWGSCEGGPIRAAGPDGSIRVLTAATGTWADASGLDRDGFPASGKYVNLKEGGLAADAAGNIYLTEAVTNIIWKIGADGILRRVAGTGKCVFGPGGGDGGPAR